jgi:GNAT superfamily N-acetyltransferase
MAFNVRTAAVADIPAMHAVRSSVRENRLPYPQQVTEASYLPYIAAGSAWVAEADAVILGFAAIDAADASIWALFVGRTAEGAGIGRALHQRMLEWAREQGIPLLSLSTQDGSRAANFYERAGWTRSGVTTERDVIFEKALN